MKYRNPTKEQELIIRSRYYYDEGKLRYRVSFNRCVAGEEAGCTDGRGYKRVSVGLSKMLVHRVIWFLHHNFWPSSIDHIDRNKENNSIDNLRVCSYSENKRNVVYNTNSGVRLKGCKWECYAGVNNKYVYLGRFSSEKEAKDARESYLKKLYGDFHV